MALEVRYDEIRSDVIEKLLDQKEEMEFKLKSLENTVSQLPSYMEGETVKAYINEFETIVKNIYSKLNVNIGDFAGQLESVCEEFEKLDEDMRGAIS